MNLTYECLVSMYQRLVPVQLFFYSFLKRRLWTGFVPGSTARPLIGQEAGPFTIEPTQVSQPRSKILSALLLRRNVPGNSPDRGASRRELVQR